MTDPISDDQVLLNGMLDHDREIVQKLIRAAVTAALQKEREKANWDG